eukprot:371260_1
MNEKNINRETKGTFASVGYDFSSITINGLTAAIKRLPEMENKISIIFGESLRLLDVRSIVNVMQCCHAKNIALPDIDQIDWGGPFNNSKNSNDIRLFANIFDIHQKPLLISIYLTGYGNQSNYSILKTFVNEYYVPVNVPDDKGDTILHYMIRHGDYDGIYELLNSLLPKQRFNFEARNDYGDTILHEMIRKNHFEELNYLLNMIALKSTKQINLNTFNNSGESVLYLAMKRDMETLTNMVLSVQKEEEKVYDHDIDIQEFIVKMPSIYKPSHCTGIYGKYMFLNKNIFTAVIDNEEQKYNMPSNYRPSNSTGIYGVYYDCEYMINSNVSDIELIINIDNNYQTQIHDETIKNVMCLVLHRIDNDPKVCGTIITKNHMEYRQLKKRLNMINVKEEKLHVEKQNIEEYFNIKLMHHLLINQYPQIITNTIYNNIEQSALGFVLNTEYLDNLDSYFEHAINWLLAKKSRLFVSEIGLLHKLFVNVIENKSDKTEFYFGIFNNIIKKCDISILNICDQRRNNPLHSIIANGESKPLFLSILSNLCSQYPQWMTMQNKRNEIPLYLSIKHKDIDLFYMLCRCMVDSKIDIKMYLKQKLFVKKMIDFGSELLKSNSIFKLRLLLSTFDYSEIFRWSESETFNATRNSKDLSLIKLVSTQNHYRTIDTILFQESEFVINEKEYEREKATRSVNKYEHKDNEPDQKEENYGNNQKKNANDNNDDNNQNNDANNDEKINVNHDNKEVHRIDWIELTYATVVETFSALDLATDFLILLQLYYSSNIWWSTWMVIFLISPYLVSHGSLVVILQKKLSFNNTEKSCYSFFILFCEFLLMTPLSLLYLFIIDLIFMTFSLLSTVWLLSVIVLFAIICKDVHDASKYDIRDWVDKIVFENWLNMNRSEIVGYRRLRTLSQLFFETIPQIVLQLRMLWVIELLGDSNTFEIDLETLGWSLLLAIFHLILEGGMIYLDKLAFKMSFMEYSLECLGGRVQWIPYSGMIQNIIQNQLYICRDNDLKGFDKNYFDANKYYIKTNEKDNDGERNQILALNYEKICAEIKCIKSTYSASYQFSPQSMDIITQILINSPEIIIPSEFKMSANIVLENLMKYILCKAEIILGSHSFGSADISSICQLYKASVYKININMSAIDEKTLLRKLLKGNSIQQEKNQLSGDKKIEYIQVEQKYDEEVDIEQIDTDSDMATTDANQIYIERSLVHLGHIPAIKWIYKTLTKEQELNIKVNILRNAMPLNISNIKLDILSKCFKNKFFVGSTCQTMKMITPIIDECRAKANQEESWYFVVIFLLLYSKGNIFGEHCSNQCCLMDKSLKDILFEQFIPLYIEFDKCKIPFELFESCKYFNEIYLEHIEEIIVNRC